MPYLDSDWMVGTTVLPVGTWVPERNWDRWRARGEGVSMDLGWRRDPQRRTPGQTAPEPANGPLSPAVSRVLARDIASAQGDAFLYANLIDRLKSAPGDATADDVVDQMLTLGLASASWPEAVGGPPPHQSPRPWRKVLDWLKKLAADVGRFLLRCVDFAAATLSSAGVTAVAVGLSWVPEVSFEFPMALFTNRQGSQQARDFLDEMMTELREKMFSG